MQVRIESDEEAKALALALLEWTKKGLFVSGHLEQQSGESVYHANEREFMEALEKWVKSVSR